MMAQNKLNKGFKDILIKAKENQTMNINANEFGLCIYLILKRGGELVEAVKQGQLSVKKVSQSNSTPVSFLPNILSTFLAQKTSHARTNLAQ